jgi:L-alanine-DL-glutamate epimerase-like enolase superfamily enzyme
MMLIEDVRFFSVEVPRLRPFRIATGESGKVRAILIRAVSGNHTGWGASAPNSVTGETVDSIISALGKLAQSFRGRALGCTDDMPQLADLMDKTIAGNAAAKAGLDMALYDLLGRAEGMRTCDMLGAVKDSQMTDMSLGIDSIENTVAAAMECSEQGFRALKLKVGLDIDADVQRVLAVREAVPKMRLWADANQGYSVEEALEFCGRLEFLEFLEQPVPAWNTEALRRVRTLSNVPIMADEAAKSPGDVLAIAESGAADMINIKLMKCGGITRAIEIAEISKDYGMPNMVGCMGETMVSIAGALHFSLSQENVLYADLDSHLMLARDIATGLDFRDGALWPSKAPGQGISILKEFRDAQP